MLVPEAFTAEDAENLHPTDETYMNEQTLIGRFFNLLALFSRRDVNRVIQNGFSVKKADCNVLSFFTMVVNGPRGRHAYSAVITLTIQNDPT